MSWVSSVTSSKIVSSYLTHASSVIGRKIWLEAERPGDKLIKLVIRGEEASIKTIAKLEKIQELKNKTLTLFTGNLMVFLYF